MVGIIAASMMSPTTAYAYVKGENIVRDEDYYTMHQREEMAAVDAFTLFGNRTVTSTIE